jgi:hypothetical protein
MLTTKMMGNSEYHRIKHDVFDKIVPKLPLVYQYIQYLSKILPNTPNYPTMSGISRNNKE